MWDEASGLPLLLSETTPDGQINYVYGPGGRVIQQIGSRPTITQAGTGHAADVHLTGPDELTATFPPALPGDQILVAATTRGANTIGTPAGYTFVNGGVSGGARTEVFRRTATGGESSVTVAFPDSLGSGRIIQAIIYRNVDPANPIEDHDSALTPSGGGGPKTVTVPSLTTTDPGDQLVFIGGGVGLTTPGTWTPPAGSTTRLSDTAAPDYTQITADKPLPTPGPTGTTAATYTSDSNLIGVALALRPAAEPVRYYHHDQLGSVRQLTDTNGEIVATYSYDPHGTPTATTTAPGQTITNPFGYAGQYTDPETGFQYLRARYYDPTTAQFLTRDPAGALTRSAYGYAGNNPTNYIDPTGLSECGFSLGGLVDCLSKVSPIEGQDVANVAGGVLDGITLGHADVFVAEENVQWNRGATQFGRALGVLADVPLLIPQSAGLVGLEATAASGQVLLSSRLASGAWGSGLALLGLNDVRGANELCNRQPGSQECRDALQGGWLRAAFGGLAGLWPGGGGLAALLFYGIEQC